MAPEQFKNRHIGAVMLIGVVTGCVTALQPILLGGLLAEHRLTAAQIGQAATVEGLGTAISAAIAGAYFKPVRLPLITMLAAIIAVAANSFTISASSGGVIAARGINGLASGVLMWLLAGMLTRAVNPGRLFAFYITLQALAAFALSSFYATYLVPRFGIGAGYGVLAALGCGLIATATLIPRRYAGIATVLGSRWPTPIGIIGLFVASSYVAAVLALWVYLVPLGRELGHDSATVGFAISAAIGVQIFAGLAAIALAPHLGGVKATVLGAAASVAALVLLLGGSGDALFYAATALFTFFWMFVPPFHMSLMIAFDSSRRSALFLSSAQLIGVAAGPMIASTMVANDSFRGAAHASIGLFAVAALLSLVGAVAKARADRAD